MPATLQISFRNMDPSSACEDQVRGRVAELDKFYDRIIACHVVLEEQHRHHQQGRIFHVRVDLVVPGREIVVRRDPGEHHAHEDMHVAIRDAFDAVRRQLEDHVRRMDNQTKTHEEPAVGRIATVFPERDYGFLVTDTGEEVYVHRNSVVHGSFDALQVGDKVRYVVDPEEGEKGPQASTVVPLGRHD
jgi:ribosomal subunit interface protein